MAGLGKHVGTQFSLRSRMDGSALIGGQQLQVWYFTHDGSGPGRGFMGDRQLPSVHFEPIEGKQTSLDFFNDGPGQHTIHLHGLDVSQRDDGVPSTSFSVNPFQSATYQFIAPHAGTYIYHCHVDTVLHYAKGMYGVVIVRPPDGSTDKAWMGGPSFDEEVVWHLSTVDSLWHPLNSSGFATARFQPDAFLLNGLESAAAQSDPFTRVVIQQGQKAYIRLAHVGFNWARVSLGGPQFEVVASDGRPMQTPVTTDVWEIGPGERYDLLFTGTQAGTWTAQVDYLDDYSGTVHGSAHTTIQVV